MRKILILLLAALCLFQLVRTEDGAAEGEEKKDDDSSTGKDDGDDDKKDDKPDVHDNEVIEAKLASYNKNVRPKGTNSSEDDGGPVVIHVNFYVRRLAEIDEEDMDYEAELTFRQQWKDERLAYDSKYVDDDDDGRPYLVYRHAEAAEKIWTPDTFFQNAVDVRDYDLMEPNELVRIYPDGNVVYSKRISLKLAQSLDLEHFPFDVHDLILDISSYGHDDKDVVYKWRNESPIQVKQATLQDPNFELVKVFTKRCSQPTSMGRFSCLRAEFEIERQASRTQLFEIFGPSFVLVVISWLPFMLSTQSLLLRALIGLGCLITIILQIGLIDDEIPETHEFTWAHIWLITCFAFIVAALFQLVAYSWLIRIRVNRAASRRNAEKHRLSARTGSAEGHTNEHSTPLLHGKGDILEEQPLLSCETIFDLACLLAFALGFFIFNCYFWTSSSANIDDEDHDGTIVYDAAKRIFH